MPIVTTVIMLRNAGFVARLTARDNAPSNWPEAAKHGAEQGRARRKPHAGNVFGGYER